MIPLFSSQRTSPYTIRSGRTMALSDWAISPTLTRKESTSRSTIYGTLGYINFMTSIDCAELGVECYRYQYKCPTVKNPIRWRQARRTARRRLGESRAWVWPQGRSADHRTRVKFVRQVGRSLSVLVVGREDLRRQYFNEEWEKQLMTTFWSTEPEVWNRFFGPNSNDRPDEVFLVTGQILASEFTVYHGEAADRRCSITMQTATKVQTVDQVRHMPDVQIVFQPSDVPLVVKRELRRNESPRLYSIFLEVKASRPVQKIDDFRELSKSELREAFGQVPSDNLKN